MNPRDTRFDPDHFEAFIERSRAEIVRRPLSIDAHLREIIPAMYSAGYPVADIRPTYVEYLESLQHVYPGGDDVLYSMSFALMLGIEPGEREMLAAIAADDDFDQPFYAFLEDALDLEHPPLTGKKGAWRFFPTLQAIPDKEGKQDFIATYLKRSWYNSWRSEYWWGFHSRRPSRYFGYWAWEFGALVKAWGLDDSSFRGNRYYPADMAHYLDQN